MKARRVFDPDAVDVIPKRVRDGQGPRLCPCQYGHCGHCSQLGQHENCTARHFPPGGTPAPATYLVGRDGTVPFDYQAAQVWEIGHPHRWVCPCHAAGHHDDQRPAVQGDLFDLLAGAA